MDNTSLTLNLRVPEQTLETLSFADGTEKGISRWIDSLPKANIGETARQLYQGLIEFNQLIIAPDKRLDLLELIRPQISFVCTALARYYLGQSIVLEERPRKIANLSQALENHLANGYKIVILQADQIKQRQRGSLLALAIQRAISTLSRPIVRAYQLYRPAPDSIWLEIHQLFRLAHAHKLQDLRIKDPESADAQTLSIKQTYTTILLMGAARPNQMRQKAMAHLMTQLESWSRLVKMVKPDSLNAMFVINPDADAPPRYRSTLQEVDLDSGIGLDTRELTAALTDYLLDSSTSKLQVTDGMGIELLQHLNHSWGDLAERTFDRLPGNGELRVTIGMSATHFHLAGQSFAKFIEAESIVPFSEESLRQEKEGWGLAFDGDKTADYPNHPVERIEYTQPGEPAESELEVHYPIHCLKIVNHSPRGFCISWPEKVPRQLQAGELLGVQEEIDHGWSLAVVRWIRQVRGGGTQMGVELIAPHCSPCAIKLLRNAEEPSHYLRALLIPEVTALEQPETVITPRLPFQLNSKVMLRLGTQEVRAQLIKSIMSTGSFSQFQHEIRQPPEVIAEKKEPSTTELPISGGNEFDSLWKLL